MKNLQMVDPTRKGRRQTIAFAPRPASLRNLRIGLLDNGKVNAAELLLMVAAILEQEHGVRSHVLQDKPKCTQPAPREIIAGIAATSDVVVTGIGD